MAVEELSAEEKEFFSTKGEKEPPVEEKVAPEEKPTPEVKSEQKADKPEVEKAEKKAEDKKPPEGFVPHGAFHAEREERKKLEQRLEAERIRIAKMEERFNLVLEKTKPAVPDIAQDPVGHFQHKLQQTEAELEQARKFREEQANRARLQEDHQRFMSAYHGAAQQFERQQQDFGQAYAFLAQSRIEDLTAAGYDFVQAQQLAQEDELRVVAKAFQDGVNPAERMYALAKRRGYAPKPKEGEKSPAEQKLETIERGQKASPEFSPSSQGKPKLTLAAIAEMSDEDFAKLDWEKTIGKLAA
jgi:hypothetical protein